MKEFKQFTTVAQIAALPEDQKNILWKWANRTKRDRPMIGVNGMPLLSIGRCIEFLIDRGIPMNQLMVALADDFHNNPDAQLIDILWQCVSVVLAKPKLPGIPVDQKILVNPGTLKSIGTMVQWIDGSRWKQLAESEMAQLWKWAGASPDPTRLFSNLSDRPMLSIGRLLEFLTDNNMTLKEIFSQCMAYENAEWSKMQLIDVLWEKVKLVLKLPIANPLKR